LIVCILFLILTFIITGNMQRIGLDNTAVTPQFRTGLMSLTCGVTPGQNGGAWVELGEKMSVELAK